MTYRSNTTFSEERDSFRPIQGIFWESPYEYPDSFAGIVEFEHDEKSIVGDDALASPGATEWPGPRERWPLRRGGLFVRPGTLHGIAEAARQTDADFAEAFWDSLGIDIQEALESVAATGREGCEGKLRALTAQFGTEAFGTYCPWHAFGDSVRTPWGIYMFEEKLFEWACLLHQSGKYLPEPKPPREFVHRLLWWLTYRHELFHFHVELFATRLESALRVPRYRPYVTQVRSKVAKTATWWEEALAQAVALKSTMVKRSLEVNAGFMKDYMEPYFRTFPEGYKRFECKEVQGGVEGAHRILSAQIARAQVDIPIKERNTGLSLAKFEYGTARDAVPGYHVLRPSFYERFQLQTPSLRETLDQIQRMLGSGKGGHSKVEVNGQVLNISVAKSGNTLDLASARVLARAMGLKVFELVRAIG